MVCKPAYLSPFTASYNGNRYYNAIIIAEYIYKYMKHIVATIEHGSSANFNDISMLYHKCSIYMPHQSISFNRITLILQIEYKC